MVMMTCGHRGLPQRIEEKRVSRLLRKSGFIPMLEQNVGRAHEAERKSTYVKPVTSVNNADQQPKIAMVPPLTPNIIIPVCGQPLSHRKSVNESVNELPPIIEKQEDQT